jgi:hypothetical protein
VATGGLGLGVRGDQPAADCAHLRRAPTRGAGARGAKLYDLSFSSLRPREFLSLAMVGEWKMLRRAISC